MPSVPEVRPVFDALRPYLEEVVFGSKDFKKAAFRMQSRAEDLIKTLGSD